MCRLYSSCVFCELTIWPALLNSLSDGELMAEIAKYLRASLLKSGNFFVWHFHQGNGSSSPSIVGILVYSSISFFNLLRGVWRVVEVVCDICRILVVREPSVFLIFFGGGSHRCSSSETSLANSMQSSSRVSSTSSSSHRAPSNFSVKKSV